MLGSRRRLNAMRAPLSEIVHHGIHMVGPCGIEVLFYQPGAETAQLHRGRGHGYAIRQVRTTIAQSPDLGRQEIVSSQGPQGESLALEKRNHPLTPSRGEDLGQGLWSMVQPIPCQWEALRRALTGKLLSAGTQLRINRRLQDITIPGGALDDPQERQCSSTTDDDEIASGRLRHQKTVEGFYGVTGVHGISISDTITVEATISTRCESTIIQTPQRWITPNQALFRAKKN